MGSRRKKPGNTFIAIFGFGKDETGITTVD